MRNNKDFLKDLMATMDVGGCLKLEDDLRAFIDVNCRAMAPETFREMLEMLHEAEKMNDSLVAKQANYFLNPTMNILPSGEGNNKSYRSYQ